MALPLLEEQDGAALAVQVWIHISSSSAVAAPNVAGFGTRSDFMNWNHKWGPDSV